MKKIAKSVSACVSRHGEFIGSTSIAAVSGLKRLHSCAETFRLLVGTSVLSSSIEMQRTAAPSTPVGAV
jgi:hypothetical protein